MLPIFFITALLISAGLLYFGYVEKDKAIILIAGTILIMLGVSATIDKIDYESGTNTTALTENQYQPFEYNETTNSTNSTTTKTTYLLMNSTETITETINYGQTSGFVDKIFGIILAMIGLYFIIASLFLI